MFIVEDKIYCIKRCELSSVIITISGSFVLDDCILSLGYLMGVLQIVYTPTKQTTSTYCNYNTWQLTAFYRVYFIVNYKHLNLLVLLSFIILMIFVTLAKQNYKNPWRLYRCIEICRKYLGYIKYCLYIYTYIYAYIHEGESNENLKSTIKIRNTVRFAL